MKTRRRGGSPGTNCCRGPWVRKFLNDLRRSHHRREEVRENALGLDEHQIVKWRRVGDDLHRPSRLRSVEMSSPTCAAVARSSTTLCRYSNSSVSIRDKSSDTAS